MACGVMSAPEAQALSSRILLVSGCGSKAWICAPSHSWATSSEK